MTYCPCCSNSMTRHIRQQQVYWFCRTCWQEMPLIEQLGVQSQPSPALKLHRSPRVSVRSLATA